MNLCYLIFIILFIYKIEPNKIRPNFDEIFVNEWNKNEREEKVMIKIEQIDQNEFVAIDQMGGENGMDPIDQQKREMIRKFDAIKEKLKAKGNYHWKNDTKIERKIAKLLGANIKLIQKWKNELNLNKNKIKKRIYEQKKCKFIEQFDEFKELYGQGKQKEFIKDLGISERLFLKWKKKLLPKYHKIHMRKKYLNDDKLEKMKQYFEIKEANPKMSDKIIATKLGIGNSTMKRWKKEFSPVSEM